MEVVGDAANSATRPGRPIEAAPAAYRRTSLDRWLAVLIGAIAFALYLPTMFPGLGGGGDAAKFQYLGRVLGTAHPPGYPTYVLISHVFSYLPIGSLAYRMNLMSACWAAVGAGLMYLVVGRLGASRWAAAAAALGLAFGRYYWSYAVHAEVYTLAAALEAGVLLKVLDWGADRRERDLYAAVALAALAVGNHLTIAFVVPALVVYVLATDARRVLRPRVLAITAALVMAGLAQYLFIILRTVQHAPYIEASATNLRELVGVVTARLYADQMWVFDATTLVKTRIPSVLWFVRVELGLVATLLLVPGVYWLARTRWRDAALLLLGFLGMLVVTANVDSDMDGFMVPAFVLVWPIVGAGLSMVGGWSRRMSRPGAAALTATALAALVVVPQYAGNYRANDHHRHTFEARYFSSLFAVLPARAAVVREAYAIDQLVLYEMLGERAGGQRDIRLLPPDAETIWDAATHGYRVFAFDIGRHALEAVGFRFSPVGLGNVSLARYLAELRKGTIVVLASAPRVASRLSEGLSDGTLEQIGGSRSLAAAGARSLAIVGVVGARGALEALGPSNVEALVGQHQAIGSTGLAAPVTIHAHGGSVATISVDGRDVVSADGGMAVATIAPNGRVMDAETIDPTLSPLVPFDMRALPLYVMTSGSRCDPIGNLGWKDATSWLVDAPRLLVRIDNYRPFDADAVLYLSSTEPLAPRMTHFEGTGSPRVEARNFSPGDAAGRQALRTAMQDDGVDPALANHLLDAPAVSRVAFRVNDEGQWIAIEVDPGGHIQGAIGRARVDRNNPERALLCGQAPF
jgi:hypothetical protein